MGFFHADNLLFKWRESKTVNVGSNSFTLTNDVPVNGILKITDNVYGVEWTSPTHYTRNNKIITLTESTLSETLTFQIDCFI